VKAVGGINDLPLTADRDSTNIAIEGYPPLDVSQMPLAEVRSVTPHYFEAMTIPLLEGRTFTTADTESTIPVVIVNQTLARRFFANENPVGRRIMLEASSPNQPWMTIVGVVGDVRDLGLEKHADLEVYQPYQQNTLSYMNIVARTEGDPRNLAGSLRNEIRTLDKGLPVVAPEPMENVVAASIAARRFNLTLLGVFAGLALFLAAVGIYGVMSYGVSQRTQEIGIRVALGATAVDILKLILRNGMILAGTGIIIGLVGAIALSRLMTGLLFGITATDTLTFAGVSITMLLVALAASYLPARRATKIDPLEALRNG
jgi:putative ABC transport system permease protein